MTSSIAELRARRITFEPAEAVAITQQLIRSVGDRHVSDELAPPFGPPSAESVFLNEDGSVVCRSCGATPAISEMAIFLDSLLPGGSQRVPGGLRYTIARALLDVEAPPFDSLDDFSRDLARHEHGAAADLVRGVLARSNARSKLAAVALADRRRPRPAFSSALRRDLREADARLYEQQQRRVESQPPTSAPAHRSRPTAAAACLFAGFALIATGQFMHSRRSDGAANHSITAAAPSPVVGPAPSETASQTRSAEADRVITTSGANQDHPRLGALRLERPGVEVERGIIVVRDVPSRPPRASRPVLRQQPSANRVSNTTQPAIGSGRAGSAAVGARPSGSRPPSRTVLDRLRLGWLRKAFTPRADL